jgi:hypothetical protein
MWEYSFSFFAFCGFVLVFVVATDADCGVEDFEKDDFFRGRKGTCSTGFGEDTVCVSPSFVRS